MKSTPKSQSASAVSRREFLKSLAAGTAAACAPGFLRSPLAGAAAAPDVSAPTNFGRMFRLPPFAPPTNAVREALLEIGRAGGIMDADDDLEAGPVNLITDATLRENNPDNSSHTAGVTFFGQFLDHDVTFDSRSRLGFPTQPVRSPNARTPFFDLDSVYAGGPSGSPKLYEPTDSVKLIVESGGKFEDLPRDSVTKAAFIGDPRNDENLIIAGLHAAFLKFHNHAVDLVRAENPSVSAADAFEDARRLTTWHYQWIIVHEFLPSVAGKDVVEDVFANGRKFFNPRRDEAFIPVEWQIAYRFGHSMVRPSYRANMKGDANGEPFFAMIFDPAGEGQEDPVDLRGGARAPRRFIGWQTFFDFGGTFTEDAKTNKRIDTKVSTPLFRLPLGAIASGTPPVSLMQRNMLRHLTWQIPSGQRIAREIGAPLLSSNDLSELRSILPSLADSTPLLYYVLKEAHVMRNGQHLGPAGARIVTEVFIGLLQLDPHSYLNLAPNWRPTLRQSGPAEDFSMVDFLIFAGVDPASRRQ